VSGEDFITDSDWKLRCTKCGCKGEEHRASTGTCPATHGWGSPKKFPSFRLSGTSAAADKKIDLALAKYWASRERFTPEDQWTYTPNVGYHRVKR